MNTRVDIDQAIDRVAKQMTDVEESPAFAARLVASLPDRAWSARWLLQSWVPRLAVVAMAVASVLFMSRASRPDAPPVLRAKLVGGVSALRASVAPFAPGIHGTRAVEPLERLERLQPMADHEFSLPSLDVESLPVLSRPGEASIDLAPLAIADLPLSGEFPEQQ